MASKHKITAYTSDTRLYEWATKEAEKKGMKRSAYLESLIREEMHRQKVEIGDTSPRLKAQFTIFENFTPREEILSAYASVNYDADSELKANFFMQPMTNPQEKAKNFLSWLEQQVHANISADFHLEALNKYILAPDSEYHTVFLKTCFRGWIIKDEKKTSLLCNSQTTYLPLLVTEALWDKYDGRYDFFNIRYLRQADMVKGKTERIFSDKYIGAALIFEKQHHYKDSGGFFIPVLRNPVSLKQRLTSPSLMKRFGSANYLFTGVGAGNNKERFVLKGLEHIRQL